MNQQQTISRTLTGVVISNKMDKSLVVLIERKVKHPKYGKYVRKSTKVHVHDELNSAGIGDIVVVIESRPISKTKNWILDSIKEKAPAT